MRGEPAAAEAVGGGAADLGADLTGHASRPATPDLLAAADVIVGMTAGHLHGLAGVVGLDTDARLLCRRRPICPTRSAATWRVYQTCAGTIWQHLHGLVDELVSGDGRPRLARLARRGRHENRHRQRPPRL